MTGTNALKNASLIMFQKICQIASLLSLLLSVSMAAFGYLAIRYMGSPEFERTLKNKIMGSLEDKLPDVMENKIPNFTGPSVELPETKNWVNPLGNTKN